MKDLKPNSGVFTSQTQTLLEALCVVDDGMRNEGAWAALSQSLGFMFS